ncbi:glycoside hydrolase family 15 protein [Methanoculleus sp. FWC-SCC3]|uniref:Glycoside hydrolase family 15 protein n=1 Tax=Methanoculleus methanifontis TaxID=2584086 RepID=A0ABT8M1G4_9EURY|nr:glycoside hydrolase family 15 protein [Methanoculleus sp. FWC-SCC3]MDN7012086.1 glycoside hydrolase family 15 protein [Methanoculleus sp. FWC-SCC3]
MRTPEDPRPPGDLAPPGYLPISDYGIIGNLRTAALVGRNGSVDWCCFPYLESPSVFAAILDAGRGGRFSVSVADGGLGVQDYIEDTNVLVTRFQAGSGRLAVTDLMPLTGEISGRGESHAPPVILRILDCEEGTVEVAVEWSPRFDYAQARTSIEAVPGGWLATSGGEAIFLCGLEDAGIDSNGQGANLHARFMMQEGDRRVLQTRWGLEDMTCDPTRAEAALAETISVWRTWAHYEDLAQTPRWAGEWLPYVTRAELTLKLLTMADSGAIAAAPTTSLPEEIGGVRNWDYRYAWVRDASMTAQALISLGHPREAIEFLQWMERTAEAHSGARQPQVLFALHDATADLTEVELTHLEGYRESRPVRIGNAAANQLQLEIFGELISTGYELIRRGVNLGPEALRFLSAVADYACSRWTEPDQGIWEIRGPAQHFVYSKVMVWVALDRAIYLAEHHGLPGDVDRWRRTRETIRERVLAEGYDPGLGSFVQSFGSKALDAVNLRIPLVEFLPFDDERVQGTIDATLEHLTKNGLVYRYLADDGLPGGEGAFGLCTFWLVDVLALSGRVEEAREIFDGIVARANHLGLLPEEFDPDTGEFLGNFPQAFTHIGLVNSALYLAHAEGRWVPEHAPAGIPREGVR